MDKEGFRYVFGPVPSRRLGRSLGVDTVPLKTCSYDCLYCQIGRTTALAAEPGETAPIEAILEEVGRKLAAGPRPDYLTVSGSGEPTLCSRLGELIAGLKSFGVPVALLTNGSLLWREDVAAAASGADLVCPSLDAGSEEVWKAVNRPAPGLDFEKMTAGLVSFRKQFSGKLWLEVLLLAGVNDTDEEVRAIAEIAARVRPDKIQLNTAVRPPAESSARPVGPERLEELAGFFTPRAEIIASFSRPGDPGPASARRADVLAMLRRRPCTLEDVSAGLGIGGEEAAGLLDALAADGQAASSQRGGRIYWSA